MKSASEELRELNRQLDSILACRDLRSGASGIPDQDVAERRVAFRANRKERWTRRGAPGLCCRRFEDGVGAK